MNSGIPLPLVSLALAFAFGEPFSSERGEVGDVSHIPVRTVAAVVLPKRKRDALELHPCWCRLGGMWTAHGPHVNRQACMGLQEAAASERRLGDHGVRTVAPNQLNDLLVTDTKLDHLLHVRVVHHRPRGCSG